MQRVVVDVAQLSSAHLSQNVVSVHNRADKRSDTVNADMSSFFHGRLVTVFLRAARNDDDGRYVTRPWSEIMFGR